MDRVACVRITCPAVANRVAAARVQRYTGTKRGPGIRPWFRYVTGMQGETREKGRRGTDERIERDYRAPERAFFFSARWLIYRESTETRKRL